jgi:hypothetical protein
MKFTSRNRCARKVIGGKFKYPNKKFVIKDIIAIGQATTVNGVMIDLNLLASTIVNDKIVIKKMMLGN